MVTLTRFLGALVRVVTRTRRRRIALLVLPALIVVAILAPRAADRDGQPAAPRVLGPTDSGVIVSTDTVTPTATIPNRSELPGTTGSAPGPTVRPRPAPVLGKAAADVATAYAVTISSHDARSGQDAGFIDSYVRARPYVTAQLYRVIAAPSRRGDFLWGQWTAQQATVTVAGVRAGVPDGAPAPTPTSAHVRVLFRQVVTPHTGGGAPMTTPTALSVVVRKDTAGHWLVSQLLADT